MTCLLAGKAPAIADVKYPVIASPKIDGIRALSFRDGHSGVRMLSRTMKPIPNAYVQQCLHGLSHGLDGELWVAGATTFGEVSSAIMSRDGEPDWRYIVFDHFNGETKPYRQRLAECADYVRLVNQAGEARVELVESLWIRDAAGLEAYEARCLAQGHEGVMLRDPAGPYKFGRSSTREGILLKMKRFEDTEAVVIGFEERMHNENEATQDAFGRTERSSHKAGLRPAGDLGKLVCRTPEGIEFGIGTGFTADDRRHIWEKRADYLGRFAKYRHQPHGAKEAPRCPVFLGFRHPADMGE